MPDILITENLRGTSVDDLSSRFDVTSLPKLWKEPAELLKWTGNFRAIIVRNRTQIKAALLNAGKKLVLGRAGDLGNVDVTAATRAGILVTSIPDQNAISVAELAMGLMLSLARMIPVANQDTEDGNWRRQQFLGTELCGKTVGIIGAGRIGYLTARRAQSFGMKMFAYDPCISRDNVLLSELNAALVRLDDRLARADIVSCHLPVTTETVELLNAKCRTTGCIKSAGTSGPNASTFLDKHWLHAKYIV